MLAKIKFLVILFAVLIVNVFIGAGAVFASGDKAIKAAWIYGHDGSDNSWYLAHDLGRKNTTRNIPWLQSAEITTPDELTFFHAINELAAEKYDIVFVTTSVLNKSVQKAAKTHPDMKFSVCIGEKHLPNVGIYNGDMEQGKFLAGISAGLLTKSNTIGYVTSFPVPEEVRFLNAFALGVKQVSPKATVKPVYVNSWYNPKKEAEVAKRLIMQGVDVITTGADSTAIVKVAEKNKTWVIGYNIDAMKDAPNYWVTAPIWNWQVVYRRIIGDLKNGKWDANVAYSGDLKSGSVQLAPWGKNVPKEVKLTVAAWQKKLVNNEYIINKT